MKNKKRRDYRTIYLTNFKLFQMLLNSTAFDGDVKKKESAYKPGSVESSHSSAMRVAAHL